jgi:hypothetical protein
MIYRAAVSGAVTLRSGREVTFTTGDRVDSRAYLPGEIDELEERLFIFTEDVEAATAAPGEKRSTRRQPAG